MTTANPVAEATTTIFVAVEFDNLLAAVRDKTVTTAHSLKEKNRTIINLSTMQEAQYIRYLDANNNDVSQPFKINKGDKIAFKVQFAAGDNSGSKYDWRNVIETNNDLAFDANDDITLTAKGTNVGDTNVTMKVNFKPIASQGVHGFDDQEFEVVWDPKIVIRE